MLCACSSWLVGNWSYRTFFAIITICDLLLFMKSLLTAVCSVCFWLLNKNQGISLWDGCDSGCDYLSLYSPLYSHDTDRYVPCPLLTFPSLSLLSSCMRFAEAMRISFITHCLKTDLFSPAGTRQRGASPLGSAALAVRSKECSRAQPWREPCCHLMGW